MALWLTAVPEHNAIWEMLQGMAAGAGSWWIIASAIHTMPPPQPLERWYGWLYNFAQMVAANHDKRAHGKVK